YCDGLNKQNSQGRRIPEDVLSIKDFIVQRDRQNAKAKCARTREQLMGGIIHRVFWVIERVNVQIDFDPFLLVVLAHTLARFSTLVPRYWIKANQLSRQTAQNPVSSISLGCKNPLRASLLHLPSAKHASPAQRWGGGMADTYV